VSAPPELVIGTLSIGARQAIEAAPNARPKRARIDTYTHGTVLVSPRDDGTYVLSIAKLKR